ncbi:MAG: sulfite exporter TauE/SafE family protein [Bacteroidota bacterium]
MIWTFAIASAFFIGLSKGGLKGMGPIFVLLMLQAVGGKSSTGLVLLLLLFGDSMALYSYRKYIQKAYVMRFLPWVFGGVVVGTWIGRDLSETNFKQIIAGIILISTGIMALWDLYLKKEVKPGPLITGVTGTGTGVFTMLGNLGGAFSNIFFLLTKLPKKELIGTSTLIYLAVNLFKLPFHVFIWKTINWQVILLDLKLLPAVLIGFLVGLKAVHYISEIWYRRFLYIVTFLGALFVLMNSFF